MIYLPCSPATGGPMLAAYIAGHRDRRMIFDQIAARLEPAGLLGDDARFYIAKRPQRRAVLRGILLCLGQRLPEWTKDNPRAAELNRSFMDRHRASFETMTLRGDHCSETAYAD